jgi:hypothetical protein
MTRLTVSVSLEADHERAASELIVEPALNTGEPAIDLEVDRRQQNTGGSPQP